MLPLPYNPTTEQGRRQLVTMAPNLTADTPWSAKEYERMLLNQFVQGTLTIDQVIELVARQKEH